jgi:hypothetical protein
MTDKLELTTHERHSRLVKIVRKEWQKEHDGARLFVNTSGVAWQGNAVSGAGKVELLNPRPIAFGIPAPEIKGTGEESGGADLIGETQVLIGFGLSYPVWTAIEIKTGASKLKKNQKIFRAWVKSVNGIYHVARECPLCWDYWEPVIVGGKIVEWIIPACSHCDGRGYILED